MHRVEMGERIFGDVSREIVVEFFIALMEYFPKFYAEKPLLKDWTNRIGLNLHHIMAQVEIF